MTNESLAFLAVVSFVVNVAFTVSLFYAVKRRADEDQKNVNKFRLKTLRRVATLEDWRIVADRRFAASKKRSVSAATTVQGSEYKVQSSQSQVDASVEKPKTPFWNDLGAVENRLGEYESGALDTGYDSLDEVRRLSERAEQLRERQAPASENIEA